MLHPDENLLLPAIKDYYYLINNQYPEKGTLKLVGDRYKLSSENRTLLYRGICSEDKADVRSSRLTDTIQGNKIVIDGYNVLFTILNYRMGRLLFIANDNILRDAGSLFGKIRKEEVFVESVEYLIGFLSGHLPQSISLYLDSPVSHSKKHAEIIKVKTGNLNINVDVQVVHSADHYMKLHPSKILCTSDGGILDQTSNPVFDLSRNILEHLFNPQFPNLRNILANS